MAFDTRSSFKGVQTPQDGYSEAKSNHLAIGANRSNTNKIISF